MRQSSRPTPWTGIGRHENRADPHTHTHTHTQTHLVDLLGPHAGIQRPLGAVANGPAGALAGRTPHKVAPQRVLAHVADVGRERGGHVGGEGRRRGAQQQVQDTVDVRLPGKELNPVRGYHCAVDVPRFCRIGRVRRVAREEVEDVDAAAQRPEERVIAKHQQRLDVFLCVCRGRGREPSRQRERLCGWHFLYFFLYFFLLHTNTSWWWVTF